MNLELTPQWLFSKNGEQVPIDGSLFRLLRAINDGGSLQHAANEAAVSYRHAWGLIKNWEVRLGADLIDAQKGRGARLTATGHKLLELVDDAAEEIKAPQARASARASARLAEALADRLAPIVIASSHGDRVHGLKDRLSSLTETSLEVAGSETALRHYEHGEADIAGFHIPLGSFGRDIGKTLLKHLDDERDQIYLLEQRVIGMVSCREKPITSFAQAIAGKAQFINRQEGSGTRMIVDAVLRSDKISAVEISGFDQEEYSHDAVCALIASGRAAFGVASAAAAARLELHFEAIVDEHFYLVIRRDSDARLREAMDRYCDAQDFSANAALEERIRHPSLDDLFALNAA